MATHSVIPRNIVVDGETAVQEHDDAYNRCQGQQLGVNAKPGKVEAYLLPEVFSEGKSKSNQGKKKACRNHGQVKKHKKTPVLISGEDQYVTLCGKKYTCTW